MVVFILNACPPLPSPCSGKITFYTHPPDQRSLPSHLSADIVREWGAAFDLPSLEEEERQLLSGKLLVHSVVLLLKIERWCEAEIVHSAPLEIYFLMESFLAKVKIFRFWPKTMEYNPWFDSSESKKSFERSIPSYRKRREKSNGICFSRIAPSSAEL